MIRIFIDTAPLIYLVERADYLNQKVCDQFKNWFETEEILLTSTLTLMELLVNPKKSKNPSLENRYKILLKDILSEPLIPIDDEIAVIAAEYRVKYGLKSPDAIQVAAAKISACDIFYTNDKDLSKIKEFEILTVE